MAHLTIVFAVSAALISGVCLLSDLISKQNNDDIKWALKSAPGNKIVEMQRKGTTLIADDDDPHGPDPHDEIHDGDLPANKDKNVGRAPKDPYGGQIPNSREPY